MSQVKTLECESVLSDLVLQGARAAIPADVDRLVKLPACGERNHPLIPLLVGLVDALQATASAVADNAWDACHPIDGDLAKELVRQCRAIALDVESASQCPDSANWSLPSMTAKELV